MLPLNHMATMRNRARINFGYVTVGEEFIDPSLPRVRKRNGCQRHNDTKNLPGSIFIVTAITGTYQKGTRIAS